MVRHANSGTEPPIEPADSEQPLLRRWSQRKLASAADASPAATDAATTVVAATTDAQSGTTAQEQQPPAPPPLPDLDSLDENSDYSGFLSPEVESGVRRVALRKLFGLPGFAVRDGLDDYDDDFGNCEVLGSIVTHEMKRLAARELAMRERTDDGALDSGFSPDAHPTPSPAPSLAGQSSDPEAPADDAQRRSVIEDQPQQHPTPTDQEPETHA